MNFISNMKIRKRLLLGFNIIILFSIIIPIISIFSLQTIDNSYSNLFDYAEARSTHIMEATIQYENCRRTLLRMGVLTGTMDHDLVDEAYQSMLGFIDELCIKIDEYKVLVYEDQRLDQDVIELRLSQADAIVASITGEFLDIGNNVYESAHRGDYSSVVEIISEATPVATQIQENITSLKGAARDTMTEGSQSSSALVRKLNILVIVISVLSVLLSLVVALLISNSITKPIVALSKNADAIARGDLDVTVASNQRDEIGQLTNNIGKVVATIRQLMEKISTLATELNSGSIDAKIDSSNFDGYYKEVADKISQTTSELLEDNVLISNVIQGYADGNFDVEIKQFPGDKAATNVIIDTVRKNLKSLNADIIRLIESATAGNLDIRVDASAYHGDWKIMVEGLNYLLVAVDEPITEVCNALDEVAKSNLHVRVNGEYQGLFNTMKEALNATVENTSYYIKDISEILIKLSEQNLDVHVDKEYNGDFSSIKHALVQIVDKFNMLLSEINLSVEHVATGAGQISQTSMVLAQGATEQARSVEEIGDTIGHISKQIDENASNTSRVRELANSTKQNGNNSKTEMANMLNAMQEINDASDSISKIIKAIDDIAFQTNLLALNAAVEAARAGQQGKGFAVVADEVRSLAARSQNAAQETSGLIQNSIEKVMEGTKMANSTSESLNLIVSQIDEISSLISDVAAASEEQSKSINQINAGVTQIATVTQSNTATSEEAASSAQELASQSEMFKNTVAQFKLRESNY